MTDNTLRNELAGVIASHIPTISPELLDQLADAAATARLDPTTMQRILGAFDALADTVRKLIDALLQVLRPVIEWAAEISRRIFDTIAAGIVPRRWIYMSKHAKKARTRKKYRNRIRRAVFAALAAEAGGGS